MASDFLKFLTRLWNALLLTKSFEWEVNTDLETCKERLSGLIQPQTGSLFNRHRTDVKILIQSEIAYNFQIDAKRYGRGMDYSSAHAVGRLTANPATHQTHVHLEIRMGLTFLIIIAFTIAYIFSSNITDLARIPGSYIFLVIIIVFFLRNSISDYTSLLKRIPESLQDL